MKQKGDKKMSIYIQLGGLWIAIFFSLVLSTEWHNNSHSTYGKE